MKRSTTAKAWRKPLLTLLAFAVVLSFCVQLATSYSAEALTVTTTTAKSNQASGNSVVGGQPTRVTWEAKVDEGEAVSSVTLTFPAGSSFADNANVQATILYQEDPRRAAQRIEVEQSYELDGESVVITFGELIETDYVIRVEVHNVALPALGGEYVVGGSYVDENGAIQTLADSPTITVIGTTLVDRIITWLDGQKWVESWNSVLFLRIFFNPQLIVAAFPNLFFGWLRSLGLVLLGFPLAIPFGLGFAFLRMSRLGILRFLASIYVNVIRGTPLFLQMYIVIIGIQIAGASFNSYFLGVIVLAVNSSAYLAEIFRAGIQSIHKGQFEASASLGMNGVQTMFSVIIPQTVRRVIPTATSEFILLYKDTALLAAVGVMEMMMFAKSMAAVSGNMTPYVVAACYYLVVTLPLTKVIANFEKKLAAADGTTSEPPAKKKKRVGLFSTSESNAPDAPDALGALGAPNPPGAPDTSDALNAPSNKSTQNVKKAQNAKKEGGE